MNDREWEPAVVVVDNDPSVRRALSRLLLACGLVVHTYISACCSRSPFALRDLRQARLPRPRDSGQQVD
jgi:hypothetical protein